MESWYQEGYLDYLRSRLDDPDSYLSIADMTYDEFLATCNVFPDVDFSEYSRLCIQAAGIGCIVTFEKSVYRDDSLRKIICELDVIKQGSCKTEKKDRNLVLVPGFPRTSVFSS